MSMKRIFSKRKESFYQRMQNKEANNTRLQPAGRGRLRVPTKGVSVAEPSAGLAGGADGVGGGNAAAAREI